MFDSSVTRFCKISPQRVFFSVWKFEKVRVYFVLCKNLNLLWHFYSIGQIFTIVNDQILNL